jgi:hypothetical protein
MMTVSPSSNNTTNDSAKLAFQSRSKQSDGNPVSKTAYIKHTTHDIGYNYGTLDFSGTNKAKFNMDVEISKSTPTLKFDNLAGGGLDPTLEASGTNFKIKTTSIDAMTLALDTGNATFEGDVTVSGGDLTLGADVTLFRDGANILRTDDAFHANGHIHVGGASGGGNIYNRSDTSNYIGFSSNAIAFSKNATFVGNIKIKNALIDNASVTSASTTTTVASISGTTYAAVFFDYVIYKSSNIRAGTVVACSDGTNVSFNETSTVDLGDTSDVTLAVDLSSSNFRLRATTTSSTWNIKSLVRAI